ncbi:unnamed protein product [Cylindrotheca closterium]|uniref:Serine hydrolase domain-containing protein n=1 Tax=Cylindrotheca closterium TaxID=2856 RepID=A0AAD2FLQ2_9STRA|nr:unnamed protein product [Cylindrotheca closterium]
MNVISPATVPKVGTVLMLHGWAQNAKVMRSRSKSLTKKLNQAGYDCLFFQAPIELPMVSTIMIEGQPVLITNGGRKGAMAWFLYSQEDPGDTSSMLTGERIEYVGLEESINMMQQELTNILKANEDEQIFLLGFSQGAVLAHILASYCTIAPFNKIRGFVLVSGFPATPLQRPMVVDAIAVAENSSVVDESSAFQEIDRPSLHVIGRNDTSVPPSHSDKLFQCFVHGRKLEHEKGHILIQQSAQCATIIQFLNEC